MKILKFILSGFISMFLVFTVLGQTNQGNILIGGESNLNFSSFNSKWKSDDGNGKFGKTTSFDFSPRVGFFIIDNLAIGAKLPISFQSEKDDNNDKFSSTSLAIAPFVKYYFGAKNIKPYLNGSFGFGTISMKDEPESGPSDNYSSGLFLYEFGGGLGIFFNDKVSLDISLGYTSKTYKDKEDNINNFRTIYSGIGLGIGFSICL